MIGYVMVGSNGLYRATTCYDLNKRLLRVIPKIRQRNKLKTNSGNCLSPVKLCHNLIDTEDQNYGPQTSLRRGHIEAVA